MNSEEDEFRRIEREALRRAAFQRKVDNAMRIAFEAAWDDDDTQVYKKPWVGLTDGDWEWVADKKETSLDTFAHGAAWAADQLKEKNNV